MMTMAAMTMGGGALANAEGWGPGGGWWIVFPLFWLLLAGTVIFTVIRGRRSGRWHQGRSATDVLAERYARGEIAEEEYKERLEVLKGPR